MIPLGEMLSKASLSIQGVLNEKGVHLYMILPYPDSSFIFGFLVIIVTIRKTILKNH